MRKKAAKEMIYPDWLGDNYENYRYLLKHYATYSHEQPPWNSSFVCTTVETDAGLRYLKEAYRLDKLVHNSKGDFDTCLKAMEWTFCQLLSREKQEFAGPLCALEILNFSRTNHVTVNCLCHATVLTEVLLALGFRARALMCLPIDLVPLDNHVVTEVYVSSLDRWIMLDPALCCYAQDEKGITLSLQEIRERLIDDRPFNVCPYGRFQHSAAPNSFAPFDPQEYRGYLMKNLFRFMSRNVQGAAPAAPGDIYYSLVPAGYLAAPVEQTHTHGGTKIVRVTDNADFFWRSEGFLGESNGL
ncbi:MAG: transglutaminase-like domain-containing protein [Treponema sp.]|jgi:hypothetical protein|nr:transglutaminase-like domain-containing protein [Treponema sp.]